MSDKGIIYYKSIPAEIKKLKLTQKQCAEFAWLRDALNKYRVFASYVL
jgi:hypothetical protein